MSHKEFTGTSEELAGVRANLALPAWVAEQSPDAGHRCSNKSVPTR
jgi:hypothetical protein